MQEPWELFYAEWMRHAEPVPVSRPRWSEEDRRRAAQATSRAAQATLVELRVRWEWSLVNARILVGQLVEAADQWVRSGTDPGQLRYWLHAVWTAERSLCRMEWARRAATEAVLAGAAAGGWGRTADPDDAFELHLW